MGNGSLYLKLLQRTIPTKKQGEQSVETSQNRKRKYIGGLGEEVPSLGVLEGDILKLIWDAGEPQSSVQVYERMHFARRAEKREMQSPSTIAVTLSRMVEKGLLTVQRQGGGKGYYSPTKPRFEIVARVLNDVSCRLAGQPLGYLLAQWRSEQAKGTNKDDASPEGYIQEVVQELKRLEREDNKPKPKVKLPEF